ncbi:MAG: hypothetical protein ABIK83_12750 [Candidatus Zixiibacteriota bacterium]
MSANRDHKANEDRQLDSLVRAARDRDAPHFTRPSEEAIAAYLLGSATGAQKEEIRAALIRSASFRRELLEMAEDLLILTDAAVTQAFIDHPPPVAPHLSDFLAKAAEQSSVPDQVGIIQHLKSLTVALVSLARRLTGQPVEGDASLTPAAGVTSGRRRFSMRSAALGLASVMILGLVSIQIALMLNSGRGVLSIADFESVEIMDKGLFVSNITRTGGEMPTQPVYANHREAAEAAFADAVQYENGKYVLNPAPAELQHDQPRTIVSVSLVDGTDRKLVDVSSVLLVSSFDDAIDARIWLLLLPSREVLQTGMNLESISILVDEEMDVHGCVAITYQVDGGYLATRAWSFGF